MSRWALLALLLCACELTAAESAPAGMEEVLVEGEHPGPALWKVALQAMTAVRTLSPRRASRRHCCRATIARLQRVSRAQSFDCAQQFVAWH